MRRRTIPLLLLAACGTDSAGPPPVAAVHVTTTTAGADPDDRYRIIVSAGGQVRFGQEVGASATATMHPVLVAGSETFQFRLDEVSPNCRVTSPNPVEARLTPNASVSIAFTVACQAFGRIDLAVATGDAVLGTQFQVVTAGPGITPVVVRSGGASTIERLAAGPYTVRIGGIPANCHAVDGVSRDVTVASGQASSVHFALACGAHGRMAFARLGDRHENDWDIHAVDTDGGNLVRLTTDPAADLDPAWSPDGGRIAYTRLFAGVGDIHVVNADGSDPRALTSHEASDTDPAWSPDGGRLAFVSDREGRTHLFLMNADGSGVRQLTDGPDEDGEPAWSPDGARIAFSSTRNGGGIHVVDVASGAITQLTRGFVVDAEPAWSPGGAQLAFMRHGHLHLVRADGTDARALDFPLGTHAGLGHPAWSPDGRRIAVAAVYCAYWYYDCWTTISAALAADGDLVDIFTGTVADPAWRW